MGLEEFQRFLEDKYSGVFVPVDLLKISQAMGVKLPRRLPSNPMLAYQPASLCLVVDAESCLDRLYGGYFNDWCCGGQWNRMLQFLNLLLTTMHSHNIEVVFYFNGAVENERLKDWTAAEVAKRHKVRQILCHISRKKTPPPKILWMPPAALRSGLRMALRHFKIPIMQSSEDHHQEVIGFLREHEFDAIAADGLQFAFFDPPRIFSAQNFKLTFRGNLETRELIVDEVAKQLNLHPNRLCVLAAMMGNFILEADELRQFYDELLQGTPKETMNDFGIIIPAVVTFIRNLPTVDDLQGIGQFIFRNTHPDGLRLDRASRFVQSVHYFMNGTRENYQRFFKPGIKPTPAMDKNENFVVLETESFASESKGGELADAGASQIPQVKLGKFNTQDVHRLENEASQTVSVDEASVSTDNAKSTSAQSVSNNIPPVNKNGTEKSKVPDAQLSSKGQTPPLQLQKTVDRDKFVLPPPHPKVLVAPEILRTAAQRHAKGLMHPWIYNVLNQAELKIETFIEDSAAELPLGWFLFRPIRQSVYAVLFNLNHRNFLLRQQKENASPHVPIVPVSTAAFNGFTSNGSTKLGQEPGKYPTDLSTRITVREWVYLPKRNSYENPEAVAAVALNWRGVPTVQRLWFGQNPDDKKKRLKTFLNCMCSDTPLMLNQQNVPQHLLLVCCVLRYMVCHLERSVLEKAELDAFLAQSISPKLMDINAIQDISVKCLTPRGVQLAQMLMQGVEHALFANDACGAPIPWIVCCPWLFFDGKLFQTKLELTQQKSSLVELCDGDMSQVSQVERMRLAILEGNEMAFQRPPPPRSLPLSFPQPSPYPMGIGGFPFAPHLPPDVSQRGLTVRGRGMIGRRDLLSRGGQLEIAGVVVGQWGGNGERGKYPHNSSNVNMAPQVMSVGPSRGGHHNGSMIGGKSPFELIPPRSTMGFDYPCGLFPMMMAAPPQFSRGAGGVVRADKPASFPSYRGRGGGRAAHRIHQRRPKSKFVKPTGSAIAAVNLIQTESVITTASSTPTDETIQNDGNITNSNSTECTKDGVSGDGSEGSPKTSGYTSATECPLDQQSSTQS